MSSGPRFLPTFRNLHQSGCFVIPNPWDLGSARLLGQMGFPALATTSSGFAWSLGRQDNHVGTSSRQPRVLSGKSSQRDVAHAFGQRSRRPQSFR